jgi:hypothetical protein
MRIFLLGAVAGMGLLGAELRGFISDEACGWNNARATKEAKECAQKCVRAGWAPVFIRDGDTTAYKVSDKTRVMPFVGDHVVITGTLGKDSVTVVKVRKLEK